MHSEGLMIELFRALEGKLDGKCADQGPAAKARMAARARFGKRTERPIAAPKKFDDVVKRPRNATAPNSEILVTCVRPVASRCR